MKKILVFIGLFLTFICQVKAAETFYIPDYGFRHYLKNKFPSYFNFNHELILDSARNYTGFIHCNDLFISNLDGLQYFHKVTSISCGNNPLTAPFPSLDSLDSLRKLWVDFSNVTAFPKVNHLSNLEILSLRGNKLTELPSLEGLSKLAYLDVSLNLLTTLPDLNSLVNLKKLYAYKNDIHTVPPIDSLVNLEILDVQRNNLMQLPSFAGNVNLLKLIVNENNLKSIPDLSKNVMLSDLICYKNDLVTLPELSQCQNLQRLLAFQNDLTSLPQLWLNYQLNYVRLEDNALTFSDLVQLEAHPNFPMAFSFNPQDTAGNFQILKKTVGSSLTISTSVDENIGNLIYEWYGNGFYLGNSTVNKFTLETTFLSDSGTYTCKISHYDSKYSGFKINARVARVSIVPCIQASSVGYSILKSDCDGIDIELNDQDIFGLAPFKYKLLSQIDFDTLTFSSNSITNLKPGIYTVEITDSLDCSFSVNNYIYLPYPSGCGKTITPNGDGVEDDFFIQTAGMAKVFNKSGQLIREILAPGSWDGTDTQGRLVPMGYYVIMIDGKEKIGIVVIQ